jgi:hypothetical protein
MITSEVSVALEQPANNGIGRGPHRDDGCDENRLNQKLLAGQ